MDTNSNNYSISIENATVTVQGKEILHNITWKVKKGEKYFIIGANGAGKTTLVKLILGYIWPLYGAKVTILGKLYGTTNLNTLRKSIAWVSPFIQQYLDASLTGLDMVLSGPDGYLGYYRKATENELLSAERLLSMLNGLHLANKSIVEMSSGEQMKILIARALLTKPELIIFDEPNVYLDMAEREFLLEQIEYLAKNNTNLTMLFISQRIEDILPEFKKGIIMKSGNILMEGSREEILMPKNLKQAFGIDVDIVSSTNGRLWAITK